MTQPPDHFPLLALCARAQGQPAQYEQLRQRVSTLSSWDDVPLQAEAHGLEPLLYLHLRAAGIAIPPHIEQQLRTRTLQHAHANHVRSNLLAHILDAFQSAGIQALVLKGAALAHLVYPRPELRVMRDVDVLVRSSEAVRAQTLLAQMGFNAPLTDGTLPAHHRHLPVAQREVDGLLVSVEVHHDLYPNGTSATRFEALRPRAIPFVVGGLTAYTLGYEDTLEHVYRHLLEGAVFKPFRLIGIADSISLAERFVTEIDWPRVAPCARHALCLCHRLTPLSEELQHALAFNLDDLPKDDSDQPFWDFRGWPRSSLAAQREKRYWGILRDSFYPPEWWLRMHYGVDKAPTSLWWARLVRHPLHILGWVGDYLAGRVRRRRV
jgi:hypothetical protein